MAAHDASRGNSPEDALSAAQPAASFADEGFALCRRHSKAAKGAVSICGGAAAKTVLVREMRYASSLEPRSTLFERPSMLFCDIDLLDADFAIKHHQWVGVRDGRIA